MYLVLERAQGPPKGPLADNIGHTGVGFALVVVKLIAVFGPAVIAAMVAGDIVAREQEDGTLKTVLTRSLTRSELLLGKLLALFTYLAMALAAFFVVSTVAGIIAWGFHPLLDLSGHRISPLHALALDVPAMIVYTLPVLAIASFGIFLYQLTAWHDLFTTPTGGALIVRAVWVSVAFALPPIVAAMVIFNRRDVVG